MPHLPHTSINFLEPRGEDPHPPDLIGVLIHLFLTVLKIPTVRSPMHHPLTGNQDAPEPEQRAGLVPWSTNSQRLWPRATGHVRNPSLPSPAFSMTLRTECSVAAVRTDRDLAVATSIILGVLFAGVASYHTVRAFEVGTTYLACGPVALAARIPRVGLFVAEGARYRAVWARPVNLVLVAAWQVAETAIPSGLIRAVSAIPFLKHEHNTVWNQVLPLIPS